MTKRPRVVAGICFSSIQIWTSLKILSGIALLVSQNRWEFHKIFRNNVHAYSCRSPDHYSIWLFEEMIKKYFSGGRWSFITIFVTVKSTTVVCDLLRNPIHVVGEKCTLHVQIYEQHIRVQSNPRQYLLHTPVLKMLSSVGSPNPVPLFCTSICSTACDSSVCNITH